MTKLEQLKAAYEATTKGEWWEDDDGFIACGKDDEHRTIASGRCSYYGEDATDFIVLSHNLAPIMIRIIEMLMNDPVHPRMNVRQDGNASMGDLLEMLR